MVGDLGQRQALHAADVGDHSPTLERLDDELGDVVGRYGDHRQLRDTLVRGGTTGAETARRADVLVVGVAEPDLEPGPLGRQPDRRAEQAGADDVDGSVELTHRERLAPGEVAAQCSGAVQVDVGDVLARQVGLDVRHHPHHARHRGVDLELARADEGHVVEAELAGGVRRELRVQVGGRREDDADEVVDGQRVGIEHVAHHLGDPVEHVLALVGLELGGSPYGSDGHAAEPTDRRSRAARRLRRRSARAADPLSARRAAPVRCGSARAGARGGRPGRAAAARSGCGPRG